MVPAVDVLAGREYKGRLTGIVARYHMSVTVDFVNSGKMRGRRCLKERKMTLAEMGRCRVTVRSRGSSAR